MTATVGLGLDRDHGLHLFAVIVIEIASIRIEMKGETRLDVMEEVTVIGQGHRSHAITFRHLVMHEIDRPRMIILKLLLSTRPWLALSSVDRVRIYVGWRLSPRRGSSSSPDQMELVHSDNAGLLAIYVHATTQSGRLTASSMKMEVIQLGRYPTVVE